MYGSGLRRYGIDAVLGVSTVLTVLMHLYDEG